jgi:hypothetical protein
MLNKWGFLMLPFPTPYLPSKAQVRDDAFLAQRYSLLSLSGW